MKAAPKWRKPQKQMSQATKAYVKKDVLFQILHSIHRVVYHGSGIVAANQVLFLLLGAEWAFDLPFSFTDILISFAFAGFMFVLCGYRVVALTSRK
jgi:hypothetical protein